MTAREEERAAAIIDLAEAFHAVAGPSPDNEPIERIQARFLAAAAIALGEISYAEHLAREHGFNLALR